MNMLARVEERVYADFHQFYVADEGSWLARSAEADTGSPNFWSKEASDRGLAVLTAVLGIGTASYGTVSVVVEVNDVRPPVLIADFDRVVEASLNLASGSVLVIGCTAPEGAVAHGLPPGWFRVAVCSAGLDLGVESGDGGIATHCGCGRSNRHPPR